MFRRRFRWNGSSNIRDSENLDCKVLDITKKAVPTFLKRLSTRGSKHFSPRIDWWRRMISSSQRHFQKIILKAATKNMTARCSATYLTSTLDLHERSISRPGRFNSGYKSKLLTWLEGCLGLWSGLDCVEKKMRSFPSCPPFYRVEESMIHRMALMAHWFCCTETTVRSATHEDYKV